MSCEPVVRVRGLSKAYRLFAQPHDRLKHALLWRFGRTYGREFWALRDVSFDLCPGKLLAVIGRNGSGKSTLLQLLVGTLRPTSGEIHVRGRVAALLELGMGFNPEFTGRENIYLNGAILGLSHKEVDAKVDEIVTFADIGDFIDQPVKYYSSGMFIRLAFAVTTGLEPDVLLVDEALAVGDVFFRQKCYQRMRELLERGTAVVLVTHSMADVEMFAHEALLLQNGSVRYFGNPSEAVRLYMLMEQEDRQMVIKEMLEREKEVAAVFQPSGEGEWPILPPLPDEKQVRHQKARCVGLLLTDEQGRPRHSFFQGEVLHVYYEFEMIEEGSMPIGGIAVHDEHGILVHGKTALESDTSLPHRVAKGSRIRCHQWVKLNLAVGEYTLEIGLVEILPSFYQQRERLPYQDLRQGSVRLCHVPKAVNFTVMLPHQRRPAVLSHHGMCDLPGGMEVEVIPPREEKV